MHEYRYGERVWCPTEGGAVIGTVVDERRWGWGRVHAPPNWPEFARSLPNPVFVRVDGEPEPRWFNEGELRPE